MGVIRGEAARGSFSVPHQAPFCCSKGHQEGIWSGVDGSEMGLKPGTLLCMD